MLGKASKYLVKRHSKRKVNIPLLHYGTCIVPRNRILVRPTYENGGRLIIGLELVR